MASNFINSTLAWLSGGINTYSHIIFSVVVSALIVFAVLGKFSPINTVVFGILFYIIYYLVSTRGSRGLNISIHPTLRDGPPPHLGRDGVSLVNYYPNKVGY